MIQGIGCFGIVLAITVWVTVWGREEEGLWRYRGIRRMWRTGRKRGWNIPDWLEESMVFRTWLLLFAGSVLLAVWGIGEELSSDAQVKKLKRPEYGQGSIQEELKLEWEKENGRKGEDSMLVEVGEKSLTEKEIKENFRRVKEDLSKTVLGENTSADRVNRDLQLPEKLEGFPGTVSWSSSNPETVDWEGKIGADIPEEGKLVCLNALLTLGEAEDSYFQYVRVFPREQSFQEEVQQFFARANEETEKDWMTLPEQIQGRKLYWTKSGDSTRKGIAVLLFLCPFLLLMRDRQAVQEKKKLERQQMLQDYPDILSKLTLLLSAGVNLRKAMERIGEDYVNYKKDGEVRKAYEVILEICGEMDRGVSEKEAYERLGERCGILPYRTLSALLVQHLQKGSRGMERMLEEEAQKAQEQRQQQARALGEQASTKLLVPMILMLMIVFVILMVPVWLTFTL
ncbi:MAG: type II secretion system F family protein [Clostridiales bacterium]|nr:type II secretion system F family protein [Clostridiales bacterium]